MRKAMRHFLITAVIAESDVVSKNYFSSLIIVISQVWSAWQQTVLCVCNGSGRRRVWIVLTD